MGDEKCMDLVDILRAPLGYRLIAGYNLIGNFEDYNSETPYKEAYSTQNAMGLFEYLRKYSQSLADYYEKNHAEKDQ